MELGLPTVGQDKGGGPFGVDGESFKLMNTSQDPGAVDLDGGTRTHPEAQPPARRKSMVAQVKPTAIPMVLTLDQHAGKTLDIFAVGCIYMEY